MGNYFRGQTEQILFGVKGSLPLKRKDAPTYFMAPRGTGGHSSKPVEFYSFVESCSHSPYLEMFSRHQRDGWSSWGENGLS
jgi:N6-adenosine-specific RNA methylase IME4